MTLGHLLKNRRTELGKSIEQIATATRINVRVLKALEEDQYAELPAKAFTRGFIITYCRTLQLDPEKILSEYHDFLESKFQERPSKDQGHQGYTFETKENEQNRKVMVIFASIAGLFAILTLLFFKPQNHRHREKHKELTEDTVQTDASVPVEEIPGAKVVLASSPSPVVSATPISSPSPSPSPTPIVATSPSPSPSLNSDPLNKGDDLSTESASIRIQFEANENTLIHYRSDQKKPSSITLRKGKQLVIKGMDQIQVQTLNPERLKYQVRFKNKPSGGPTEMKEKGLEIRSDGTLQTSNAGSL